jgi:hypothetical protein
MDSNAAGTASPADRRACTSTSRYISRLSFMLSVYLQIVIGLIYTSTNQTPQFYYHIPIPDFEDGAVPLARARSVRDLCLS